MGHFYNIRLTIAEDNKMFWFLDDKTGNIQTADPISNSLFTNLDFNEFVSWEIWTYKPVKTSVFVKKN
jgi:hypothetical protein